MTDATKSRKSIKQHILQLVKDNQAARIVVRKMWSFYRKLRYLPFYLFSRVNNTIILFESFSGRRYNDNPRALFEEMVSDVAFNNTTFIWAFRELSNEIPAEILEKYNVVQVKYDSISYLKYYARAKYVITNSSFPVHVMKKKKQCLVQTWHGTPLKRLGCDLSIESYNSPYKSLKQIHKSYSHDGYLMDYLISPSPYTSEKLSYAFDLASQKKKDIILEIGYPRNDFLYTFTQEQSQQIKEELLVPEGKKVLLYAPTWRDNEHSVTDGYTYLPDIDFDYLRENLSDEYVLLYRTHQFIEKTLDLKKYKGFIINVSDYSEVSHLYVISDILITDYSSVFFDYANLRRPIIFYMYDMDTYLNETHGLYFDVEELPGPICKTESELIAAINGIENGKSRFCQKYDKFNEKFTPLDDGDASKRFVEIIKKNEEGR